MIVKDQITIEYLNYLTRTYEAVTKTIVATKNRLVHLNPGAESKNDDIVVGLEKIKGQLSRRIAKQLEYWPIWSVWMKHVPGCGPTIASNLIMFYYYRFTPVCKKCGGELIKNDGLTCGDCGEKAKSDGVLQYKIGMKHFPKVSSWWHYMGVHCDDSGRKPKLKKGTKIDWNSKARATAFQIGESFIKGKSKYREFFDARKAKREQTHPDASKAHRNNMARNETAKLFLSHFIQVAKKLDGEEFTKPYVNTVMGHTNVIEPFYFEAA